jgi:hypothetical protein
VLAVSAASVVVLAVSVASVLSSGGVSGLDGVVVVLAVSAASVVVLAVSVASWCC